MFAYVAVLLLSLGPWISIVRSAGNVGCLFSDEVCDESEFCFNDLLFGECKTESSDASDFHRHTDIPLPLQKLLEEELKRLWVGGYRWPHQYTQCVVQNLLYAETHRLSYDPGLCVRILKMTVPKVTKEILEALEKISPEDLALIKFKPNKQEERSDFADEVFYPDSKTESEANAASRHRLKSTSTLLALPGGPLIEMEPEETKRSQAFTSSLHHVLSHPSHTNQRLNSNAAVGRDENEERNQSPLLRSLLASLEHLGKGRGAWGDDIDQSEDEDDSDRYPAPVLPVIKTDLSSDMNQRPAYTEGGMQWVPVDDEESDEDSFEDIDDLNGEERRHFQNFGAKSSGIDARRDTNEMEDVFEKHNFDHDTDDESKFGDSSPSVDTNLWRSYVDVPKINIREDPDMTPFSRPMRYDTKKPGPNFFLNRLHIDGEESNENDESQNQSDNAVINLLKTAQHEQQSDQWKVFPKASLDGAPKIENGKHFNSAIADLTDEEKALQDLVSFESSVRHDAKIGSLTNEPFIKIQGQKEGPPQIPEDEVSGFSKKREYFRPVSVNLPQSQEESPAANLVLDVNKNYEVVDSTHTYLRIAEKSMNINSAEKLVKSLERFLKLPTGTFSNIRMGDSQVIFKVNPNPQSLNASLVAERAEDLTNALKKATGLTVISAGIGDKKVGLAGFVGKLIGRRRFNRGFNGEYFNLPMKPILSDAYEAILPDISMIRLLKDRGNLASYTLTIRDEAQFEVIRKESSDHKLFILTFVLCGCLVGVLIAVSVVYVVRHHARSKQKLQSIAQPETDSSQDYQDLCRQRMQRKNNEKPEPIHVVQQPKRISSLSQSEASQPSPSSRSSTSSWSEEPVTSNMDISTGHMILSYMEDHLKNKDRLEREWEALCAYEAEPCSTSVALLQQNQNKNRYSDVLPYDHSRVILNDLTNVSGSDYINASTITDHDPRNPAYIATQGPLPQTAADFWQMIWEQGSVVIVTLSRLMENGFAMCHRYWPEEGSEVYHIYEVHLVSEHIWCDDYLVRSFYLKNLKTSETRTVTQFHFLSWPENGVPASTKALLEFRRKVNKSYRGRSCPIVAHCSDGSGRTGTYCLIDMVLNRMAKGAKEIDIAATLEHIRDQRSDMVKTKAQFEFVLMAIAEEVHAILKALSQ